MSNKYTPKPCIEVSGKMSKRDAGTTAKMYAAAAIIAAMSLFIWAVRWW